ncbi:hypothetical protein JCM10449v2_002754 [Rhodotorula kratochvilovae]
MRRPSRAPPLALRLALAAAALAPLASAAAGVHHPAHAASHGSPAHAAGHAIFAASSRDNAAGAGAGSLLVERAAEVAAMEALCDKDAEDAVAVGWTEEDDLWASTGTYDEEGAGALHRRWGKNATASASGPAAAEKSAAAASEEEKVADTSSLEAKLLINPKFLALNPKWTPKSLLASRPTSTTKAASTKTSGAASSTITTRALGGSGAASTTRSASSSKTSTAVLTLPAPPASTCATQYTNTAGGAVYGPGLGDFAFLPRPSTFVKRSGNKLVLDGETYRIVGPNIYWLGLDENVNGAVSYPSHGRIREAMAITVALGGNTIRAHTLGCSTGHSKTLWPSAWNTNDAAWNTIDYSIWAARNYGLRLIIPLTDNYAYYHGGKYDFIGWAGADTSDGSQFYYNKDVIKLFKGYISVLLNHVNIYTGVALKDDPTIMAWETGNELGGYMLGGGAPPTSWNKDIAAYIKKLAPNHLVADGTDGLTDYGGSLANTGIKVSDVDLVTDHFYPALQWLLQKDKNWMTSYPSKVFYVGENDWTGVKGGDDLDTFYATIEGMSGSGSMMWSIFGHDDRCCNWIYHNDGYSLYYPNGMNDSLSKAALKLMKHWYRMRGLTPPSALPAVACPQPELEI